MSIYNGQFTNKYILDKIKQNIAKFDLKTIANIVRCLDVICKEFYNKEVSIDYVFCNSQLMLKALTKYANANKLSNGTKEQYVLAIILLFKLIPRLKTEYKNIYYEWSDIYTTLRLHRYAPKVLSMITIAEYNNIVSQLNVNTCEYWLLFLFHINETAYFKLKIFDTSNNNMYIKYQSALCINNNKPFIIVKRYVYEGIHCFTKYNAPKELAKYAKDKEYLFTNDKNKPFKNIGDYEVWANAILNNITKKNITLNMIHELFIANNMVPKLKYIEYETFRK